MRLRGFGQFAWTCVVTAKIFRLEEMPETRRSAYVDKASAYHMSSFTVHSFDECQFASPAIGKAPCEKNQAVIESLPMTRITAETPFLLIRVSARF